MGVIGMGTRNTHEERDWNWEEGLDWEESGITCCPLITAFFLGGHQSNLPEPCARLVHRGECLWCTS